MPRRFIATLLSFLMAAAIMPATVVAHNSPHNDGLDCRQLFPSQPHRYVYRELSDETPTSERFSAAEGTVWARYLHPCGEGAGLYNGFSVVLPVNIWQLPSGGSGAVQLGYGVSGGNWFGDEWSSDYTPRFIYTPNDCTGGVVEVVPWAEIPEINHKYKLRVAMATQSGQPKWLWTITDLSDSSVQQGYTPRTWGYGCQNQFGSYGRQVWWGYETRTTAT